MAAPPYGVNGFLAPETMNGLAYIAPQGVPPAPVMASAAPGMPMAFLAPPLFNGMPYLAAPYVFVMPEQVGGGGRRSTRSSTSRAKSSPVQAPTHYHSRSDEQEIARLAAQLDDEEIVLAFLMEIALV